MVSGEVLNILSVRYISKRFGGVKAIDSLSFELEEGTINALIGPNGAGKTTAFNVITGFLKPDAGAVYFCGERITSLSPWQIARLGIGRTFQDIRLFSQMSVLENVMLATRHADGLLSALLQTGRMRQEENENMNSALNCLKRVGLLERKDALAHALSHGQQKLLGIARAIALDAGLLLLDEPTAGLFPGMVGEVTQLLYRLRDVGKTILLIEHDMGVVMDICDNVIVLDHGRKIAEGMPCEMQRNKRVIDAYLGGPNDS